MHSLAVSVALLLVSCASAEPDSARRFFPLEAGNEWTFEDTRYGGTSSLSVTRARAGVYQLERFESNGCVSKKRFGAWFGPTPKVEFAGFTQSTSKSHIRSRSVGENPQASSSNWMNGAGAPGGGLNTSALALGIGR